MGQNVNESIYEYFLYYYHFFVCEIISKQKFVFNGLSAEWVF